jgi:hypothetical protein
LRPSNRKIILRHRKNEWEVGPIVSLQRQELR